MLVYRSEIVPLRLMQGEFHQIPDKGASSPPAGTDNSMIDFYDQKAPCMYAGYELTNANAPLGSLVKKFLNLKKKSNVNNRI